MRSTFSAKRRLLDWLRLRKEIAAHFPSGCYGLTDKTTAHCRGVNLSTHIPIGKQLLIKGKHWMIKDSYPNETWGGIMVCLWEVPVELRVLGHVGQVFSSGW